VATVFGIPIRIHLTFALILLWVAWWSRQSEIATAQLLLFVLSVFACLLLHEIGHALMAKVFGVRTREIVLYPIGGVARLERMPNGVAELLIAIAGPVVNLVLAGLLLLGYMVLEARFPGVGADRAINATLLRDLCIANLLLFAFNLLPAFPMDGGRILRATLSLFLPIERATDIAAAIGQSIAILLAVAGLLFYRQAPLLILIALFVFLGAGQEAAFQRQRATVRGRTTREAMVTKLAPVAPQHSLRSAADLMNATGQRVLAVVDAWQRVVGVLPRATLMRGLAEGGDDAAVLDVMVREFPTISPDAGLERALERLRRRPGLPLVVLEDGRLAGLITLASLAQFIEIERSSGRRAGDDPREGQGRAEPRPD
jgi:Zn-dependent protease